MNPKTFALSVAFAVLAAAGCADRSRFAVLPPTGPPTLDVDKLGIAKDSPAVGLAPPHVASDAPPPQWQSNRPIDIVPASSPTIVGDATPRLRVGIDGARSFSPGDAIPLEVSVSNTGAGPAKNVKLRADFDAALHHETGVQVLEVTVGTLAPGQSHTVPLALIASQPGKPAIRVTANGDGGLQADAARSVTITQRALQFGLSGKPTRYVNRPGAWDVRVANIGDAPLTKVTARVRLPQELRFVSATGNGQFTAGEVVWTIGDLRPGERRELQLTATPVSGVGQSTLTGLATADKVPAQSAEVAFEVMGMPVLRADILPPANAIAAGGKGIITVRVTNQGTLAARNVMVTAVLPPPFLTPRFGAGPTVGRVNGDRVEFAVVTRIEAEQSVTFQIEVAAGEPGDRRMQVEVRSDSTATPLTAEEAIRVVPAIR